MRRKRRRSASARRRPVPVWREDDGQLLWGRKLIKQLSGRAKNQGPVLSAFQRAGWPRSIADPLPRDYGKPEQRLHDTIKSLNHGLQVLRFHGDGSGTRVWWEPVKRPRKASK